MHIYPIFVERRPPPKGYWQLVGEWIRAMEWPDATEKECNRLVKHRVDGPLL
jgi:hypothetical protein